MAMRRAALNDGSLSELRDSARPARNIPRVVWALAPDVNTRLAKTDHRTGSTVEVVDATAPRGVLQPWRRATLPLVAAAGLTGVPTIAFAGVVPMAGRTAPDCGLAARFCHRPRAGIPRLRLPCRVRLVHRQFTAIVSARFVREAFPWCQAAPTPARPATARYHHAFHPTIDVTNRRSAP